MQEEKVKQKEGRMSGLKGKVEDLDEISKDYLRKLKSTGTEHAENVGL